MILFDFHHHNRENTYGIYNLEPKEIVIEKKFSVGIHPKDIDENWEENFEKINCLISHQNGDFYYQKVRNSSFIKRKYF